MGKHSAQLDALVSRGDLRPSGGDTCEARCAESERVSRAQTLLLDEETYSRLAAIFHTLADASRAKIVYSLLRQELCTCDLAAITGLSEPAVSQHLRLLRGLQLVRTRREGRKVYYLLDDAHVCSLLTTTLTHLTHGVWQTPEEWSALAGSEAPAQVKGEVR